MARCTVLYLGGQSAERLDEAGLVGRATFNGEAVRVPSAPRSALERGDAACCGGSDLVAEYAPGAGPFVGPTPAGSASVVGVSTHNHNLPELLRQVQ